jgi:hypothetical protein
MAVDDVTQLQEPKTDVSAKMLPPVSSESRLSYSGLSEKARLWILVFGGAVAAINLFLAWYFAMQSADHLQLRPNEMAPLKEWLSSVVQNPTSNSGIVHDLLSRGMNIMVMVKLISNKQSLVLTCFGAAFAMTAIGFSLFVIGADGAFKVMASTSTDSKLVVIGTAPGLLCFVLATILILVGVTRTITFKLPPLPSVTASTTASDAAHDTKLKCDYFNDARTACLPTSK